MKAQEIAEIIREIINDRVLMETMRLAIEDEAVDRRDRGIFTANRNGIAIFTRNSQPSPIIRIGTRDAIIIALQALIQELEI